MSFFFLVRVSLSVMYLMVETVRTEMETDPPKWKASREAFRMELGKSRRRPVGVPN